MPAQAELPLAYVAGEAITEAPKDLYIPPDALEIFLEAFEGPLDLLLYLIKRQNIDILEINVADITDQYMAYVELMHASQFEWAAEYLVMAAMLAEIKSRILLPRQEEEEAEEGDPRMQVIRRLQAYESFKPAAAIAAGKGYWVLALEDCYLHITTTPASAPAIVAKPARMTIALTLRTEASQKELVLGADPNAKAGLDRYDRPMPPPSPLGKSIDAYLHRDEDRKSTRLNSSHW